MKLADYCNISPGYIGEIESGRKFPSSELIEKIANALRIEPYILFKNPKDNNHHSDPEKSFLRLPYSTKKQIITQIKKQIKSQLAIQINAQLKLSTNEIMHDITEILDKY